MREQTLCVPRGDSDGLRAVREQPERARASGSCTEETPGFGKISQRLPMEHAPCLRLDMTTCNGKRTGQKVTGSEALGPVVAAMLVW